MSKFEVISGVEGCCLALDDTRIAGPKPWGGGTAIHAWETGETYKAVNVHSRWHELFGTPEKAARTLYYDKQPICAGCALLDECNKMPDEEQDTCLLMDYDALLEWLRGDAE